MKRIPMILLLIAPYLFVGSCLSELPVGTSSFSAVGLVLFAAVLLFNMAYAFILPKFGYGAKQLLFWNMLLKLCNIPIFLLVFSVVLLLHVLVLPLIPFLFLFDYSLLLPSTMYGVSGLLACYRQGVLSSKAVAGHLLAQFIFCLDVFSAIYCYLRVRRLLH